MSPGTPAPLRVLANERAGRSGTDTARLLSETLQRAAVAATVRSVDPVRLHGEVASAVERGEQVIGIAGGDGSLLTASAALVGKESALLAFPTGTLNHFARRIGIDSLERAADAAARGHPMQVPVGVVDDRIFLNTATFGLYADVVRHRERLRRWLGKWPAAAVAIVQRVIWMRRLEVVLETGGRRLRRTTPLVWVGVGWGSFPRVHESPERRRQPDLEIVVLRPRGRLGMVALGCRFAFLLLRNRRPVDDPALEVLHARSVLIRARRRVGVTLDGEPTRLHAPLFIGIVDDALRVVAPPAEDSDAAH